MIFLCFKNLRLRNGEQAQASPVARLVWYHRILEAYHSFSLTCPYTHTHTDIKTWWHEHHHHHSVLLPQPHFYITLPFSAPTSTHFYRMLVASEQKNRRFSLRIRLSRALFCIIACVFSLSLSLSTHTSIFFFPTQYFADSHRRFSFLGYDFASSVSNIRTQRTNIIIKTKNVILGGYLEVW